VDWSQLAQDRYQWRVLVNMVTDFPAPAERQPASQEGMCSMESVSDNTLKAIHGAINQN